MKRLFKIVGLSLLALLLLVFLAVFLLPYFVRVEPIKQKFTQELSEKLKARVSLGQVDLRLLPRPALKVETLEVDGNSYFFRLDEGLIVLKLRPLFSKKIEVERFYLLGPDLELRPSKRPPSQKKPSKTQTWPLTLMTKLAQEGPRLPSFSFEIRKGRFKYWCGKTSCLILTDLEGSFSFQRDFLEWELAGRSATARTFKISGRLWPEEKLSEGLLRVTHFDLSKFPPVTDRYPKLNLTTDLNLELSYRYEEGGWLLGFTATAPCVLRGKREEFLFECSALLGQARIIPPNFRLEIKNWVMRTPLLKGQGVIEHKGAKTSVVFDFEEADWLGIRKRLLSFFEKKKGVQKLCDIVQEGIVHKFHLETEGSSTKRLFRIETLRLAGLVEKARLNLPKPKILLEDVSGQLYFDKGRLEVKGARARFQKTTISSASFLINLRQLKDRSSPFLLQGKVKGFTEDVLLVLERTPLPPSLREKVRKTKGQGPLSGELRLSGSLKRIKVYFSLLPEGVRISYGGFPLPLMISGGRISYQDQRINFQALKLESPQSQLFGLTASLDLRPRPWRLLLEEARGTLSLAEINKLLETSFPRAKKFFETYHFRGKSLILYKASYQGPVSSPKIWEGLRVRFGVEDFSFFLPALSQEIFVKQGTATYQKDQLFLEPSEIKLLDLKALLEGEVSLKPLSLGFKGKGSSGPEFLKWLYQRLALSEDYFPHTPLTAQDFSFSLKGDYLFFEGKLEARGAPFSLWLERKSPFLSFRIELGKETSFSFFFKKEPEFYHFALKGYLNDAMVRDYLLENPFLLQEIKGDLSGQIDRREILKSSFRGEIELSRFRIPSKRYPFWIESLDLKAQGKDLSVRYLEMDLDGTTFQGQGQVEITPSLINIEGSVYTPTLVVEDLLKRLKEKTSPRGSKKKKTPSLALALKLELRTDSAIYRKYELSPFEGEVLYYPGNFRLFVRQSYLCGIKVWGLYQREAAYHRLDVNFDQPQGELRDTLECFLESDLIEGPFSLKGYLRTQGQKRLFEKSSGRYLFVSEKGHIYKFGTLAKIFAILSPMDLFQGNLPDFQKKGTDYNLWKSEGHFEKKYLVVDHLLLEAPGFRTFASGRIDLLKQKMDLTVLVSPFKMVDSIIGKVPLIGWVLTGKSKTFLAVPVKVRGKIKDPSVVPLDPTAVGANVLNIIKRTFQLPIKIFVPEKDDDFEIPPIEKKAGE